MQIDTQIFLPLFGSQLARLESKIAISTLLRRCPNIQIKGEKEQIKWKGNFLMRALEELPLSSNFWGDM
ncbi:hypothetical protein C6371_02160 [Bacillus atrophaeus]|nr:hypothetical protein C6371_02160 [Bacillus atrophaeus]